MPRFVDTHCHLAMEDFSEDRPEVMDRAAEAGVERILVVGSDEAGSTDALGLVKRSGSGLAKGRSGEDLLGARSPCEGGEKTPGGPCQGCLR
ncbi:MAG: Hydrolase, TatD family [Synergistales bacterium 58_81]|nr:MAG: Hydrolase, TatD family [Synergistales bacterium 58_81]